MKQRKVQLKDIAQQVGVSTATVSYVLNNRPMAERISKEVTLRIRDTARALNYQPNQIAQSLKTQKTNTIGLIVADIANPFSSQIARIIEDTAKLQGYTVIIGSSDENPGKMQDLTNTMLTRQVDGLIISAPDQSVAQLREINRSGKPLVLIDRYFPDEPLNYVGIDNYSATYEAVRLLIQKGSRRIGLISYQTGLFHLLERNRGYRQALHDEGIDTADQLIRYVPLRHIRHEVARSIDHLLTQEIDALLLTTNLLALEGLRYLLHQKVNIPDQVAVIAFDEADFYDFFPVSITHIRQPLDDLGKTATEALIRHIEGKEATIRMNLKAMLVPGQSSG